MSEDNRDIKADITASADSGCCGKHADTSCGGEQAGTGVNAALNSFNKVLLASHIKTCVTRDIRDGKEETVDELVAVLQKLMK